MARGASGASAPRRAAGTSPRVHTAEAVAAHCRAAIVAAGPACVAVKLQLACFERLGAPGWEALEQTVAVARDHGLLVIADGKRGDVPVTARAYAQALVGETDGPFGPVDGLGADAFTANPLLGRDSLEPLIDAAAAAGAGCFLLVRTSNPGAGELQDEGDPPLHERLARMADELGASQTGDCGLSLVGAVTGATQPALLGRLRELMPRAVFLLPGVGAQGGRVEDLGPAFAPHPAAGLVTASRSIVNAHAERGGDPRRGRRGRGRGAARRRVGAVAALSSASPFWGRIAMAHRGRRSTARLLAPLALVLAAVAVLLVIQASKGSRRRLQGQRGQDHVDRAAAPLRRPSSAFGRSYTVKLNDTLGLISEKTGVSVERLEELNPELDPQNLIVGQKIKLRE